MSWCLPFLYFSHIQNIQCRLGGRIREQKFTLKNLVARASASTERCSQSWSFVVLRCESTLKSVTYLGPLSSFVFFNKQRLIFFPHIFWHFVAAAVLSVWSRSVFTLFALRDLKSDGRMTSSRGLTSLYNWTVVTYFHNCWEQKPLHIRVWNWWICNSRKNLPQCRTLNSSLTTLRLDSFALYLSPFSKNANKWVTLLPSGVNESMKGWIVLAAGGSSSTAPMTLCVKGKL